jgi:hypothetical protein
MLQTVGRGKFLLNGLRNRDVRTAWLAACRWYTPRGHKTYALNALPLKTALPAEKLIGCYTDGHRLETEPAEDGFQHNVQRARRTG